MEGRICSTILHAPVIVESVVTSDLIRMCVFGSALYHCQKLEGKICFTVSHAPAVPSDTAGLCDMCAILIQGRYYSLSKTNLCLYVIKRGFINFRLLRSEVTDVHLSRSYYLTAWLHNGSGSIYGGPDTTAPSQGGRYPEKTNWIKILSIFSSAEESLVSLLLQ